MAELDIDQRRSDGDTLPSKYEQLRLSDGKRRVTIDVAPGPDGVTSFTIQTSPHDATVEAIFEDAFLYVLPQLGVGAPGAKVHDVRSVDAWVNAIELRNARLLLDLRCAQGAASESRAVTTIKLAADATISVDTDVQDPGVRACITQHVTDVLDKVTSLRRGAPASYTTTTRLRPPGSRAVP